MTRIRCHSFGRRISLGLIGALLVSIVTPHAAWVKPTPAGAQEAVKTVLAFPAEVEESAEGDLEDVARRFTSALAILGREVSEVDLEVFSETSPMARRAISDGALRAADIEGPKDAYGALVIGKAFRVDSVLLLTVQSLTIGGDPRTAEVAVMGTEYEVAANVDAETGTVVAEPAGNTFGVSGTATSRAGTGEDAALVRSAARDAAYKALSVLAGQEAQEYKERGAKPKKKSKKGLFLAIALVVGALVAVTAGGGDNGPANVDARLPTRLSARATPDGIRLRWVRPTTNDTIFGYQIQRSGDGGNFVRIDEDNLGPNATQFTDFNTVAGTAYVYQIRVLYTSGNITQWVTFRQIVAP